MDGTVALGRSQTEIGANVEGYNRGTIGVCLLGGYLAEDKARDGDKSHEAKLGTPRGAATVVDKVLFWVIGSTGQNLNEAASTFNQSLYHGTLRGRVALSREGRA